MVLFGFGILVVISFCCTKTIEASNNDFDDSGVTIHAIRREDPPEGCNSKHSDAGEECKDEDDKLGLYADVDDTYKVVKDKFQHGSAADDDSPDILHNNVDVLGH